MAGEQRDLSMAEWTVLAVLDEEPAHGFAVAGLTAPGAELGRVWAIPRPVVYRALAQLAEVGFVEPAGQEQGRGPRRQILAATDEGARAVRGWLVAPVLHVRDVRSQLLMKLALLERRGADAHDLVARQRSLLAPIVAALHEQPPGEGFDATLHAWRRSAAAAALAFLDDLSG